MDVEQEGGSLVLPPSRPIRHLSSASESEDELLSPSPSPPSAAATHPFDLPSPATPAPESASALQAQELDLSGASLGASTVSRSAPSSRKRDASHSSEGRRRSESSVPAFERDDELLPPSAVAPDKRSFALDDLNDVSTLAVFRVRPSSISATSPVYSSFEHPTPALAPSPSFSALPPSVAESFAAGGAAHPPSRASSADEIDFDGILTGSILTATSTPVALTPAADEFGSHPPESPPPFALPSSATSPQQRNVFSDSDGDDIPSASSFFTPDTSSASTGFHTPGNAIRDTLFRDPGSSFAKEANHSKVTPRNLNAPSLGPTSISLSPGSSTHPRSCEVYIGVFGTESLLLRYANWLHAELESHGVACFSADRSLYADQRSHDIARGIMHAAAFGVVLVARKSFRNPYTIEELTIFLDRGNLVPVFFDVAPPDCLVRDIVEKQGEIWEEDGGELWKAYMGEEKGWSKAVKGLLTVEEFRVEAHNRNWRSSIQRVVALVGSRLDRSIIQTARMQTTEELPWPRNPYFAGREKELKLMEKLLFRNPNPKTGKQQQTTGLSSQRSDASSKAETEDLESNYESENYEVRAWNALTGSGLEGNKDAARRARRALREKRRRESPKKYSSSACAVTGIPGIGKSELALEFAYRHSQKYRMVLWVGGETRYLRQNYLNLSFRLGVNVGRSETHPRPRRIAFEEQESEAVAKIRYELQKDVPYLLIIDNLDHFDARELSELLPRAGSTTHVVVTTRLPRVLHLASLEVAYLSSFEALTLMRDGKRSARSLSVQQIDKFKEFEDKLRRLPFGIAIVGRLVNEFNMKPSEILAKMGAPGTMRTMGSMGSSIDVTRRSSSDAIERDDAVLRSNPFLVKLLDVCFDLMGDRKSMAVRMAYVGGWFAPAACPLALLASAAKKLANLDKSMVSCCNWRSSGSARRMEVDARDLLTRLGLARAATGSATGSGSDCDDCLYFPDIVQVYCQKRGGVLAARAFVRVMRKHGHVLHHYEHFWAAAYLVCRYGSGVPAVVALQVPELLEFARRIVMPLAIRAFHSFARCNAALEVLRLCSARLEDVEKSYVAQIQDRWNGPSLCWRRDTNVPHQVDEYVWQDLTLLKALLLEVRAKLLMRGGQYDTGEELCRTCISIRTVMLGEDHPNTLAAQETLSKFVRKRNSSTCS